MRSLIAILLLIASATLAGASESWPVGDMNKLIDQTNFIVDDQCSGTLISVKEKLILTNDHCVENRVSVVEEEVTGPDGSVQKIKHEKFDDSPVTQNQYKGFVQVGSATFLTEIVAHDKKRDLALLRFKQDSIPMTLAAQLLPDGIELTRGEPIVTVGNPMLLEATVVRGEISSLTRQLEVEGQDKRDYIQFSGGIYGGNSGGALYNAKGQLIGVPGAGSPRATFLGFAIPVSSVKDMLKANCLASVYDGKADDAKCKSDKDAKAKADKKG